MASRAPALLVNHQDAWLLHLDHNEDMGFSSRTSLYAGPPNARLEFALGNGQRDEYPTDWAFPLEQALAACEYFLTTQGRRSTAIAWHEDAIEDER